MRSRRLYRLPFQCDRRHDFENTNKPLRDWFKVVHLMTTSKKGISALQIQRQMGFGSYKTAHGMCHKIRAAMIQPQEKLGGIVEMDETYIGGKDHNRHWDKKQHNAKDKVPIVGAVQRKGSVVTRVLEKVNTLDVINFLHEAVSDKVSLLATDAWRGYEELGHLCPHAAIDHHKHQYVVGAVHANTIEGFWSIFKRGVVATFHKMSVKLYAAVRRGVSVPLQQPLQFRYLRNGYKWMLMSFRGNCWGWHRLCTWRDRPAVLV